MDIYYASMDVRKQSKAPRLDMIEKKAHLYTLKVPEASSRSFGSQVRRERIGGDHCL